MRTLGTPGWLVAATLWFVVAGCPTAEPLPELVGLAVVPGQIEVAAGDSIQLVAEGQWSDDTTSDLTTTVTWLTADPEEAEIDVGGRVTTFAEGQATLTATLDLLAASALLTIGPAELVQLVPAPLGVQAPEGAEVPMTITGRFGDGALVELTDEVAWTSTDSGVAVAAEGVVTALAAGSAELTATFGEVAVTVPVEVSELDLVAIVVTPEAPDLPLGSSVGFAATGRFTDGSEVDVTALAAWSSSDSSHVQIDADTGEAVATGTGGAIIEATHGGLEGSTVANVIVADFVALAIEPSSVSLPLGGAYALAAVATLSDGSTADVTATSAWSSDDPLVASVSNDAGHRGVVSTLALGTATARVALGEFEAYAIVEVEPAELVSLTIEPGAQSTPLGVAVSFAVIGEYTDGTSLDHTASALWSTDSSPVAVFGAPGEAVPVATGSTVVTAAFEDLEASADLVVQPPALVSLAVTPTSADLAIGELLSFEATGTYSNGAVTDVTEDAFWASSAPGFLTLDNLAGFEGEATALAEGSATVLASLTSVTGSATVLVGPPAPVSVGVLPLTPTVAVGDTLALTAGSLLTDGTIVDVTTEVLWSSLDPTIATLTNDLGNEGVVAGVAAGNVTVTATLGPLVGTTTVEVEDP